MRSALKKQVSVAAIGLTVGAAIAAVVTNRHRLKSSRMGSLVGGKLNDFLDQTRIWGVELVAILNDDEVLTHAEAPERRIYEDEFGARRTRGLAPRHKVDPLPFS